MDRSKLQKFLDIRMKSIKLLNFCIAENQLFTRMTLNKISTNVVAS